MNDADISGIVLVVVGVLCVIPAIYVTPLFLVASGGIIAAGIVLLLSAGSMCCGDQQAKQATPKEATMAPLTKLPV